MKRKIRNYPKAAQKGKKRVQHASEWLCNVRKRNLAGGKEYIGKNGTFVSSRVMKPSYCCRMKCFEKFSQSDRSKIFDSYWSEEKSNDVKKQFILTCVEKVGTVRSRKRNLNSNKEKLNTLFYHFILNNQKMRVCKVMFLNTLAISNTVVVNALKNREPGGLARPDQRGKHTPANKTSTETTEIIKKHIGKKILENT